MGTCHMILCYSNQEGLWMHLLPPNDCMAGVRSYAFSSLGSGFCVNISMRKECRCMCMIKRPANMRAY